VNRSQKIALLARIVPVLFCLFVCAVALELFARVTYARPSMHFGLEMWKYAKYLKMRSPNREMSHQHRANTEAFLMGVDVKINSLGFRDREISVQKPPGTYRIVALGDSTTFGWGAPFDQTYPKVLEKSLNENPPSPKWSKYEVINTGVGNYNTAQELAMLKQNGLRLDPDMVTIGWYINDAEPTPVPSNNWIAFHSYGYIWLTSNLDGVLRNLGARQSYKDYYLSLYNPNQPGLPKMRQAFAELAALCKQRNIPLHILLVPELHTLSGNYEFKQIDDLIREIGKENDVPVLDLINAFPPDGDPRRFWASPEDDHPNGAANVLIGNYISQTLRREQWIR
jgi:lysophospholipase L1-like esterase